MSRSSAPHPRFAPAAVDRVDEAGGGFVLRSPLALGPFDVKVGDWLERWADEAPSRTFLRERPDGDVERAFREVSYAEAFARVKELGAGLLAIGVSRERPLLILSDNGIDHALLTLAAMDVGAPAAPVSQAYSLLSSDHDKVVEIARKVRPGAIYCDDGARFQRALAKLGRALDDPFAVVTSKNKPDRASAFSIESLSGSEAARSRAAASVDGDTIAKILFTSGSTGTPKGVVNTHRMLCSNQAAIRLVWPFVRDAAPEVVDWLPWSHTFGANHNFHLVLANGGTLTIDGGKPTPERIDVSARNLAAVSPTLYFNVPRGFDLLLPLLESDEVLRARFFARLDLVFYAAAALPQPLWDRMIAVSTLARGEPITMVSAWGSTETSPLATSVHFSIPRAGVIGLPIPGTELRFAKVGTKLELRVKGPNVTPGTWDRGVVTPAALDDEGFLPTGDGGRLEDERDPSKGVVFDGRIAENFKLMSGTWVMAGELRVRLVGACAPLVTDAVVAGHDREELGVMLFPSEAACRKVVGGGEGRSLANLCECPELLAIVREKIAEHNRAHPGSSARVARAILLREPPSIDAGEITDKGYLNQAAILARRAGLVTALFAERPGPDVMVLPR